MGRPPKKPEDRRQILTFRLDNAAREALEKAAQQTGRSMSGEIEARLQATLALDNEGLTLFSDIANELAAIQRVTKKRWHKSLTSWAAAREMLYRGPIQRWRPENWMDDEHAVEAFKRFDALTSERRTVLQALGEMGITLPEAPAKPNPTKGGLFGSVLPHARGRSFARSSIEAAEPSVEREQALHLIDRLEELDASVEEARRGWSDQMAMYQDAEKEGRDLYRDRLTSEAIRKEAQGEEYNVVDRFRLWFEGN